jgi:chromosome segregation ATPase
MKRVFLKLLLVIVLVGVGVGAGYGYGKYLLGIQSKEHQDNVDDLNRRVAAIQKKYTDERDQKATCEVQKRAAQAEIEKMRQAGGQLVEIAKELEAKVAELDGKNKELTQGLTQAREAYAALENKAAEIAAVARDRGEEIKKLTGDKQGLDTQLKGTQAQLDHCESNNARLAILGTELVEKYERKGLVTTILQNEPFTQVKKVEIENLAAEYREQIEKEKLKRKQQQKQLQAGQPQKASQ